MRPAAEELLPVTSSVIVSFAFVFSVSGFCSVSEIFLCFMVWTLLFSVIL